MWISGESDDRPIIYLNQISLEFVIIDYDIRNRSRLGQHRMGYRR